MAVSFAKDFISDIYDLTIYDVRFIYDLVIESIYADYYLSFGRFGFEMTNQFC